MKMAHYFELDTMLQMKAQLKASLSDDYCLSDFFDQGGIQKSLAYLAEKKDNSSAMDTILQKKAQK
jgi:hypothetical protein